MQKKKIPEKTEAEVMFPGKKVNKYDLEPWGLYEISQVAPVIKRAIDKCKAAGIKLGKEHLSTSFLDILPIVYEDVVEIASITTGDTIENIKQIRPRQDGTVLAMTILYQNMEYLRGFFGMLPAIVEAVAA